MAYKFVAVLIVSAICSISRVSSFENGPPFVVSYSYMYKFIQAEIGFRDAVQALLKTLDDNTRGKELAQRYLGKFEEAHRTLRNYNVSLPTTQRAIAIISSPIAVYLTVWRYLKFLAPLKTYLLQTSQSHGDLLKAFPRNDGWLGKRDLKHARDWIVSLCLIYSLEPALVADGILAGIPTGIGLNARHCYDIGKQANANKFFSVSIPFLELASRKTKVDHTVEAADVERALAKAISEHDQLLNLEETPLPIVQQAMYRTELAPLRCLYGENYMDMAIPKRDSGNITYLRGKHGTQSDMKGADSKFLDICAHGSLQSELEKSKLFCWLETTIDPYWYINPLKIEMLSTKFEVVQIYDMVGEKKRNILKKMYLKARKPVPEKQAPLELLAFRENGVPGLETLPLDLEKLSGLRVLDDLSSEELQILVYMPGAISRAHLDTDCKADNIPKDCLGASVLYFLELEGLGGETVFMPGGYKAQPVPGSFVYFFDLRSDGTTDRDQIHGGCPMILGTKWIAGKWMLYLDQFQRMRCGLTPNEKLKLFPKSKILQSLYYKTTS